MIPPFLSLLGALFVAAKPPVSDGPVWTQIGTRSEPKTAEVRLELVARFQSMMSKPVKASDHYEPHINSPKSAHFLPDGSKLYIESLEGGHTVVIDVPTWTRKTSIEHEFSDADSSRFSGTEVFDYSFGKRTNVNVFRGKPVESALSHDGKYLWVTYYRRSFDANAQLPSAVALIDTRTDSIVRVFPTGPLPKMIASSPDGKWLAVTHWGDNTVAVMDISASTPDSFRYVKHLVAGTRAKLEFDENSKVDRDNNCGNCLRGTVFTPDSKTLLVGRMGGSGGISAWSTGDWTFLGNATGMRENVRHIVIKQNTLFLSENQPGVVQKLPLDAFLSALRAGDSSQSVPVAGWKSASVGYGARTISVDDSAKYLYAAVNGKSEIKVVRIRDMAVVATIQADSYPVGMDLSPDGKWLVVTAQGHTDGGGNSVMIYRVEGGPKVPLIAPVADTVGKQVVPAADTGKKAVEPVVRPSLF
ncbi:MAG TPA: peptidoglycan-binding protein [Fibrobacteria bacterium]|nr:peptidoglycan-binding protein [Fibrobacteria bacterium]